ncbi:hypothetical protein GN956_G5694 [Arapaima gigas]
MRATRPTCSDHTGHRSDPRAPHAAPNELVAFSAKAAHQSTEQQGHEVYRERGGESVPSRALWHTVTVLPVDTVNVAKFEADSSVSQWQLNI